jgi:hypothetical protein
MLQLQQGKQCTEVNAAVLICAAAERPHVLAIPPNQLALQVQVLAGHSMGL